MVGILEASGTWFAQVAPTVGVIGAALLFAWAFIFLTVRAAVRSALRATPKSSRSVAASAFDVDPQQVAKELRKRRGRESPAPIKSAPGPRDWERKLSDY